MSRRVPLLLCCNGFSLQLAALASADFTVRVIVVSQSLDDREELEAAEPKHAALASGTSRFPDAHHIEVRKSATLPPRSRNRLLSLLLKP